MGTKLGSIKRAEILVFLISLSVSEEGLCFMG